MSDNEDADKTEEIKERLEDGDTLGGTADGDSDTVLTLDAESADSGANSSDERDESDTLDSDDSDDSEDSQAASSVSGDSTTRREEGDEE